MERKRLGNNSGFTLLEVIIALAIMTIAFASILAVEGGAINATARAKQMNIVAMLAKNQMTETEFQFEGKPFDEVKKTDEGQFKPPYDDYRWKMEVKELTFPKLGAIAGGGGGNSGGSNSSGSSGGGNTGDQTSDLISKLVTNYLSKSLREVDVTVFWKKSGGEQSYTLSTYWVDLNHEFSISE